LKTNNYKVINMDLTKTTLLIVGILVLLMGIMAIALPGFMGVTDPIWHAALKILVGLVAIAVAVMKK
jgi:hypothetical protein